LRLARKDKPREQSQPWAAPEPKDSQTNVQKLLRENVRRDEFARRIYTSEKKTMPARKSKGNGEYFLLLIAGYLGGSAMFWFMPKHNQNTMIIVAVGMLFYTIALTWFMWGSRDEF
jgi:hypothetical protein